jgi:hypothetical protein
MADLTIITNNIPRFILDEYELTPDERAQFGYLDWSAIDDGRDSASFFRYRGELYDLADIPALSPRVPTDEPDPFHGWHGAAADSFFSGILVRYCDDNESVIVGRYYC